MFRGVKWCGWKNEKMQAFWNTVSEEESAETLQCDQMKCLKQKVFAIILSERIKRE